MIQTADFPPIQLEWKISHIKFLILPQKNLRNLFAQYYLLDIKNKCLAYIYA